MRGPWATCHRTTHPAPPGGCREEGWAPYSPSCISNSSNWTCSTVTWSVRVEATHVTELSHMKNSSFYSLLHGILGQIPTRLDPIWHRLVSAAAEGTCWVIHVLGFEIAPCDGLLQALDPCKKKYFSVQGGEGSRLWLNGGRRGPGGLSHGRQAQLQRPSVI